MSHIPQPEKKFTQEDMDNEILGKRAIANHLNIKKYELEQQQIITHSMFNIIMKSNNIDIIKEMLNIPFVKIPIQYYAIKSTYTNKKSKVSECWKSAYGNYVSKINKNKKKQTPPKLTAKVCYNDNDFIITLMGKNNMAEIKCKHNLYLINTNKVKIVEDGIEYETDIE
tara:strand:+ start:155 stop:661 length:507 start_codon:yes stop_codon:yes gene_type:complete